MSRSDKKKALSSPQHSIKEHHPEHTDDDNRERKNTMDEILIEEVHTVNDWEHADLGDEQRKQKFLRLMGVKKRKEEGQNDLKDVHSTIHEDIFSLEKKHCRSKTENETINRDLEKQFNEGLQLKILHTHHEGLGFYETESTSIPSSSDDWHHQQTNTKFIPATTGARLPSNGREVKQNQSES